MSIKMSARLRAIAESIPVGSILCDVGCDHAHVPIWLLQEGRIPKALGMDVIDGPLQKAKENLELTGLLDLVELRKSDGLAAYEPGEAETLCIAGMGGTIMRRILEEEPDKTADFNTLVLGPQSDPWLVRAFLFRYGYAVTQEKLVQEDGKYYPVICAVPVSKGGTDIKPDWDRAARLLQDSTSSLYSAVTEVFDRQVLEQILMSEEFRRTAEAEFGPVLLADRDAVLKEYLIKLLRKDLRVLAQIEEAPESKTALEKLPQVKSEIGVMQACLLVFDYLERRAA